MTGTAALTVEERLAALELLAATPVLVVGPGETLIVRVPPSWTPNQVRDYQGFLDAMSDGGQISFRVVVVHGDELAVARPKAEPSEHFMDDVRTNEFYGFGNDGNPTSFIMAHLPTGVTAGGKTREEAAFKLAAELLRRGDISINDARAAHGLPPFREPEFSEPRPPGQPDAPKPPAA